MQKLKSSTDPKPLKIKNSNKQVFLDTYNNSWFYPGAGTLKRTLWFLVNILFFINPINPSSGLKAFLLRIFGASVGKGVVIKPSVNIKYPWFLKIEDHVWIGEKVWIDNLVMVVIGEHSTLSQGALLLTGSHNYKKVTFDLMIGEIHIKNGVWIGARAVVCPGITCESHSVLTAGSVAVSDLEPYTIYQGNPAVAKRIRLMESNGA
jgi:putative colanic acid biosynthesis acetyltransferase WcaF